MGPFRLRDRQSPTFEGPPHRSTSTAAFPFRSNRGEDPKKVEAVIRDDPEALTLFREAMKPEAGRNQHSIVDNINDAKTPKGTSRAYTLSRLKRESPELYQRVCAGEMSANAAAIESGFRKKDTPLKILRRAWNKASTKERTAFLKEIENGEPQ